MPYKNVDTKKLAKEIGVDYEEVKEKQRLIEKIVKTRKAKRMSQAALAKKVGVTQSRVAQIESGVGTAKITFDVLFGVLGALGYSIKVQIKKTAQSSSSVWYKK